MAETMVNGIKFRVWSDTTKRATFAESEDGRVEKIHDCGYITADLTVRKAIAMVFGLPTFRKNAVKPAKAVEETPVTKSKEQKVKKSYDEMTVEELNAEHIRLVNWADEAETDMQATYRLKILERFEAYYTKRMEEQEVETSEEVTETVGQAETETTVEQETEVKEETTNPENVGVITRTTDENTHIWVTKEAYLYLRDEMRKQRGFKPLTNEQKERMIIHITKNGMSNKIRLDHNSLGGGDGTKDGRWWGWNVVTLKSMLKKAGYSYEI